MAGQAGIDESRRQNSISRFTLLASDDKVFPGMRVLNAKGLLQAVPDLWCSKLLGSRKVDLKKSQEKGLA
jgi:hypothetical protein